MLPGEHKKSKLFLKKTKWLGQERDEHGIKSNNDKVTAINELNPIKNEKIKTDLSVNHPIRQNLIKYANFIN